MSLTAAEGTIDDFVHVIKLDAAPAARRRVADVDAGSVDVAASRS